MTERTDDALLDTVLAAYQLRSRITDNMRYCGRWRDWDGQAPTGTAWLHLMDQGSCWMRIEGVDRPVRLEAGDLVVLPRGTAHVLTPTDEALGDGGYTTMLCGELEFESASGNPVLAGLPDLMHVRGVDSGDTFRRLAELLVQEANRGGFGSQAVMDKLADALFVMALRQHLVGADSRRGLFAAMADARLRRVLDAMHRAPGKPWTVASLAAVALMSRTAFAERFAEVMEETPYQYLTRWRMAQALKLLRDPRLSVAHAAERLGYQTEAAFRRSFKRVHGYGPGSVRRKSA
ncbi:AraC family transcriptional regulator [Panacagrimonas sp.]|uniref:AraC family transcriptional regulator n=1 Tax=Panacagrimonas sp. TaxID=2480088 RepID=UPI003B51BF2B